MYLNILYTYCIMSYQNNDDDSFEMSEKSELINENIYEGFESNDDLINHKLEMLQKLGELVIHNKVTLSQNYNMTMTYKSMKCEFELHKNIMKKKNGIKFLRELLINLCVGVEYSAEYLGNSNVLLKGWALHVIENSEDYDDVLGELYEKYKDVIESQKPIPPELKIVLMIMANAIKYNMSQKIFNNTNSLISQSILNNFKQNAIIVPKKFTVYDSISYYFDQMKSNIILTYQKLYKFIF